MREVSGSEEGLEAGVPRVEAIDHPKTQRRFLLLRFCDLLSRFSSCVGPSSSAKVPHPDPDSLFIY